MECSDKLVLLLSPSISVLETIFPYLIVYMEKMKCKLL